MRGKPTSFLSFSVDGCIVLDFIGLCFCLWISSLLIAILFILFICSLTMYFVLLTAPNLMTSKNQPKAICSAEIQALFLCDQSLLLWGAPGMGLCLVLGLRPIEAQRSRSRWRIRVMRVVAKRIWREEPA